MGKRARTAAAATCLLLLGDAQAFVVPVHESITQDSLDSFDTAPIVTVYGIPANFSNLAKFQIIEGNKATDCDYVSDAPCDFGKSAAYWFPMRHFTNEVFSD